jgi:pimeloyl-ACP methyl ester carboxylesterase
MPTVKFLLKNREDYSGTVIYSHGNSSDLYNSLNFISMFLPIFPKFDFIAYDYSGYGRSAKK